MIDIFSHKKKKKNEFSIDAFIFIARCVVLEERYLFSFVSYNNIRTLIIDALYAVQYYTRSVFLICPL